MSNIVKKTANHEEFSVDRIETKDKVSPFVRPDRYVPTEWHAMFSVGNDRYEVLNYSSFGMALIVPKNVITFQSGTAVDGQMCVQDIAVQELQLRVVHCGPLSDGFNKIGLEVRGNPIDVEKIICTGQGLALTKVFAERMMNANSIRQEFRLAVLEFEDFLSDLKQRLTEIESEWAQLPRQIKTSREQGIGLAVANFLQQALTQQFKAVEVTIQDVSAEERVNYMAYLRDKLSVYLLEAPFANRSVMKPQGYAGDFEMMNLIYRDDYEGKDLFAKCLHKYYIEKSAAKAVRNRALYLESKIRDIAKSGDQAIQIASLASGPAFEVQRYLSNPTIKEGTTIHFTLIDQDLGALQHAQQKLREISLLRPEPRASVNYRQTAIKNIIARGMGEDGKYDLIYSAGLFDYLSDPVAVACIRQLYRALKPGGRLVIGNFDVSNPNKMEMEMVLDWKLIYRTADDMRRLTSIVCENPTVEAEESGINIFVVAKKPIS